MCKRLTGRAPVCYVVFPAQARAYFRSASGQALHFLIAELGGQFTQRDRRVGVQLERQPFVDLGSASAPAYMPRLFQRYDDCSFDIRLFERRAEESLWRDFQCFTQLEEQVETDVCCSRPPVGDRIEGKSRDTAKPADVSIGHAVDTRVQVVPEYVRGKPASEFMCG